jgi:hypothetical protein
MTDLPSTVDDFHGAKLSVMSSHNSVLLTSRPHCFCQECRRTTYLLKQNVYVDASYHEVAFSSTLQTSASSQKGECHHQ